MARSSNRSPPTAASGSIPARPSSSTTSTIWKRASTTTILIVDENSVLVLQNAGPLGAPGMPEWGLLPIPKKILQRGIRDMVRISDSRMSGTAYGTCVLHVAPESYVGGPLALVRDGDMITLDIPNRKLDLLVSRRNSPNAAPSGNAPKRRTSAATLRSTRSTSRRPTTAATSIFLSRWVRPKRRFSSCSARCLLFAPTGIGLWPSQSFRAEED